MISGVYIIPLKKFGLTNLTYLLQTYIILERLELNLEWMSACNLVFIQIRSRPVTTGNRQSQDCSATAREL